MVNARLLCLPACLPIVLLPGPALAWRDLGHWIIGEIAFQELNDTARERVDAHTIARQLVGEVTDEERATWRSSTPTDWANESFAISTSPEVQYCVGTGTGCWYDADDERLDQGEPERIVVVDRSYIETNGPTVPDRLVKAGIRLGGLPEQALGE